MVGYHEDNKTCNCYASRPDGVVFGDENVSLISEGEETGKRHGGVEEKHGDKNGTDHEREIFFSNHGVIY